VTAGPGTPEPGVPGVSEPGDHAALRAAALGDTAAFDVLVRRHTPRLYRVALRVVGEPADAEDVVQDAWIAAWRGLPGYRSEAAPGTWLYRVVTNAALAHLRRRRPAVGLDQADSPDMVDPGPGPEDAAEAAEDAAAVHRALARLDPGQRAAVVLREFEGLSYEEVAEVLDTTVASVRSRLHRARGTLLRHLAADAATGRAAR
jgi:RNA polymerase sigma-70 factor, ECF subfamily